MRVPCCVLNIDAYIYTYIDARTHTHTHTHKHTHRERERECVCVFSRFAPVRANSPLQLYGFDKPC